MLSKRIVTSIPKYLKRNFGVTAPILQKGNDPIQQLFLDKIKEYKTKSAEGKLGTSGLDKEREAELAKVAKQYGGGEGIDLTSFPKFQFKEPNIELNITKYSK